MKTLLGIPGPTHRGARFAGRRREIGILTHLIHEGLAGSLCLVRVAGEPGVGRRRLIAEALHHGPDAEWIHLAPGGVEADLRTWIRTELGDLLETYPEAPFPSWAIHTLSAWAPRLRSWAPVPALSRERLSQGMEPEIVGAAVGAVLLALTGQTLVIVDAGLWPARGTPARRVLESLCRSLKPPGAVVLAAAGPPGLELVDESRTRTLALDPLTPDEVRELAAGFSAGTDPTPFAGWLQRITGGRPFFIHETLRWLEEMGHLRVDEDRETISLLDPLERLPLPFNLHAVMDARYRRLQPGAARLLHLLTQNDGRLEIEALRRGFNGEDEEFEEALTALRRREFLLRSTFRHPPATASPHWREVIEDAVRHLPRQRHVIRPSIRLARPGAAAPAAQCLRRLAGVRRDLLRAVPEHDPHRELAAAARLVHGRRGPLWDAVRGRLCVLAAAQRRREGRPDRALLWIHQGQARLDPDLQPGLRRALARMEAEEAEAAGRAQHAQSLRESAWTEALDAGHLVNASVLKAAVAEGRRRLGGVLEAHRLAAEAEEELAALGMAGSADLAAYTRLRALVDARRLEDAERELQAARARDRAGLEEIVERLEALRQVPPIPIPETLDPRAPHPGGWGWGLDAGGSGPGAARPPAGRWRRGGPGGWTRWSAPWPRWRRRSPPPTGWPTWRISGSCDSGRGCWKDEPRPWTTVWPGPRNSSTGWPRRRGAASSPMRSAPPPRWGSRCSSGYSVPWCRRRRRATGRRGGPRAWCSTPWGWPGWSGRTRNGPWRSGRSGGRRSGGGR